MKTMNKRFFIGLWMSTFIPALLTSCLNQKSVQKESDVVMEDMRTVTVVDIHGDTVVIEGGATCHINKIKKRK
jgi:hypothetical protein